tara:strand:+ start:1588 stop:1815 length:228 start_codon:yes stop_codon:yes gene_type:complete
MAFPEPERYGADGNPYTRDHGCREPGMTLREYFAGLAMQALLSRHAEPGFTREGAATEAVLQADSLLEALEADRE